MKCNYGSNDSKHTQHMGHKGVSTVLQQGCLICYSIQNIHMKSTVLKLTVYNIVTFSLDILRDSNPDDVLGKEAQTYLKSYCPLEIKSIYYLYFALYCMETFAECVGTCL